MKTRRITENDAFAVMNGRTPEGREDLAVLVSVIENVRLAAFETPPQPSAALAFHLDLDRVVQASCSAGKPFEHSDQHARVSLGAARAVSGRTRMIVSWFVGLGLMAKIGLGAAVAAASVVGAGAAGVLPPPAQVAFDAVVTGAAEEESEAPDVEGEVGVEAEVEVRVDGVPNENAADPEQVVEEAHQRGEDARERAELIREEAQQRGEEARAEAEKLREEAQQRGENARERAELLREEDVKRTDEARANVDEVRR